jgi:Putative DNA-binding domain
MLLAFNPPIAPGRRGAKGKPLRCARSPPVALQAQMNREALRQQMLVRALWRDDAALQGWTRGASLQGLVAYRSNAGALAERALGSAYPTIAALIGAESFAALARHLWYQHPPVRGDIGEWGDMLPAFVADSEQLANEPYLAECARLDWAVHRATRAADANTAWPPALDALAATEPSQLRLQLRPGTAAVESRWPIVTIWRAHHAGETFDKVRAAFAAERAETALVWRDDRFVVHVEALDSHADAAFTAASIDGRSLAAALDAAGPTFSFERWLERALRSRWLVELVSGDSTT